MRVGWRSIVSMVLAILTASSVIGFTLRRQQIEQLERQRRREAHLLLDLLTPAAREALQGGDTHGLQQQAEELRPSGEVLFLVLRDAAGALRTSWHRDAGPVPRNPAKLAPGPSARVLERPAVTLRRSIEGEGGQGGGRRLGELAVALAPQPTQGALQTLGSVALLSVVVAGPLGILLTLLILTRMIRPLRELHVATERAAAGDLWHTVPVPRAPELAPLARSFNAMLHQVRRHQTEMESTNRNLEAIVNKRTRDLRRSERRYRSLLEQAGVGILVWCPGSLEIVDANAMAGEHLGEAPSELIHRKVDSFFCPRDRERVVATLHLIPYQGAVHLDDVEIEHPVKGTVPVELEASPVQLGTEALVLGMLRDLTGSKALERREALLKEKIRRSERMASIGQLAAGIAHEINNPMSYVSSNVNRLGDYAKQLAGILEQTMAGDSPASRSADVHEIIDDLQELVIETCEGVTRVTDIVTALREFSHGGRHEADLEWIDVNRVIQNCLTLIGNQIRDRAEVHLELAPLPRVRAHSTRLGQVIMNLVVNAAQAMDERGTILVTTTAARDRVHIAIEDNGTGIPAEDLPRIFDPFFTTKEVGQGTGLGLSVSHQIIEQHRGALWVDSREGHGTRFLIELPCDGGSETVEEQELRNAPPLHDLGAW